MKNTKKLLVVLMSLILMFSFAGCGKKNTEAHKSNANQTQNDGTKTPEVSEEPEQTENVDTTEKVTSYPLEIKDSTGNTITIDAEPQKIVSVAPNMTELLYELGVGDKLVGRSDYCDYPAEVSEIPSVGEIQTPDIEAITALEPDLVLVSTHFAEEDVAKLNDLGIQVLSLYSENDIYGVYQMIETVATVCNCQPKGEEVINKMKATFDDISSKTSELEHPSVYYVVGYGEYGDYTATGDTFVHGLIELAGGNNIAKDATDWSFTLEKLLEADPDIIIIGKDMAENFKATDNYKELTAVKENKVYEMDTNLFDRQGYRNAEGVKELAKLLYPDVAL